MNTQVGGGAVCRGSNLGLPFVQANNMRICTMRQEGPDVLDIAFSGSTAHTHTHRPYRGRGGAGLEPLRAGGVQRRQHGSPWFDPRVAMQDFALHLVGTVPNLPLPLSTTDPASVASALGIGHEAQVQTDLAAGWNCWGAGCSDFSIKQCASSADCSAGYLNLQGVCMHMDFETSSTSTPLWTPLKPPFKCHGATRAASTPTIRTRPRPESTCQSARLAHWPRDVLGQCSEKSW